MEPLNDNYYDLTDVEALKWQADLAKKYGIYGFCIYHYWIQGRKLLEKPLELLRDNKDINVRYCISWANHSWTDSWSGNNTMLISQDVIRRDILKVKDGENTKALPLLEELLRYGRKHSEIVILEGILNVEWYRALFELAVDLYGKNIYAYYFDIPFEETVKRHKTKPNCNDFSAEDMRRWWNEKDYAPVLQETRITADQDKESIVHEIYHTVVSDGK